MSLYVCVVCVRCVCGMSLYVCAVGKWCFGVCGLPADVMCRVQRESKRAIEPENERAIESESASESKSCIPVRFVPIKCACAGCMPCVCMCVNVCTRVCMYARTYAFSNVCVCVCVCVCVV